MSYEDLSCFARDFKFKFKKLEYVFNNWNELEDLLNNCNRTDIEGFVIEDYYKYMFKFKTEFYKRWKYVRGLKDRFVRKKEKGEEFNIGNKIDKNCIEYFNQFDINELKEKNVIQIRKENPHVIDYFDS